MQTQNNMPMCYRKESEVLGVKPLCCSPSGNRSTRQSIGIHGVARDPPSLIYPMYLSLLSSYSNKVSRNCVLFSSPNPTTSSMLHLPSLASSNASQQHQTITWHSERVWQVFGLSTSLLGSKDLGFYVFRTLICIVGKPWSKQYI